MEAFFREQLSWFGCLWDKIWPRSEPSSQPTQPAVSTINCSVSTSLPQMDIVAVLYDFDARTVDELSVTVGEELCKVANEGDYILARKVTGTMDMGLVPASYVMQSSFSASPTISTISGFPSSPGLQNTPSVINEPWYIDVSNRFEAERMLLSPPNAHGSYLVRPSYTNSGQYSLSVRIENKVIHFRIITDSKGQYYVQSGRTFPTIQELVIFHKTNWKLMKGPLLQPCVVQVLEPLDNWERPRSEFRLITKLGQGFFGEVYEAVWKEQENVAIKTFKQDDLNRSDFEKEMNTLKSLCHRNLIRLLAVCSIGEPVYIVTELMMKGNLNDYLKRDEGKQLQNVDFIHIICQVADGMEYLEKKHVVHRDLATRNVLVGENLICKIADFGLARLLKDDLYSPEINRTIPIRWTAPEALTHCKYSTKSDVWSFGIIIHEMYSFGDMPYQGMNNREVIAKILQGYRLPQPRICTMEMYNLLLTCWMEKPHDRPTFQELVEKLTDIQRLAR